MKLLSKKERQGHHRTKYNNLLNFLVRPVSAVTDHRGGWGQKFIYIIMGVAEIRQLLARWRGKQCLKIVDISGLTYKWSNGQPLRHVGQIISNCCYPYRLCFRPFRRIIYFTVYQRCIDFLDFVSL